MLRGVLRPLKVLSLIWLVLILTTIIIPGILLPYLSCWITDNFEIRIVIYVVWIVIAVYSVAYAVREDRSKADLRVDRKLEVLSHDIQQTKEDNTRTASHLSGLVDRVNDIDSVTRQGFIGLGVHLPPRGILLRGDVKSDAALYSDLLSGHERNKIVRFLRWVKLNARRLWKLLVG